MSDRIAKLAAALKALTYSEMIEVATALAERIIEGQEEIPTDREGVELVAASLDDWAMAEIEDA